MKNIVLIIFLLTSSIKLFSQNVEWVHHSFSTTVFTDTLDNAWFLHYTGSGYYLMDRYGPNDLFISSDTLTGFAIRGIQISKHSSFYIFGNTGVSLQLGNTTIGAGDFIGELDYNMNWISAANDIDNSFSIAFVNELSFDEAGNLYFAGSEIGAMGYFESHFCRINKQGHTLWHQIVPYNSIGKIQVKSNGNCYISSTTNILAEVDTTGNIVWNYPGSTNVRSISIDKSDYLYITGEASPNLYLGPFLVDGSGYPNTDVQFVAKLDASHNFLWVQQFGANSVYPLKLCESIDDRVYLTFQGANTFDTLLYNGIYTSGYFNSIFFISMQPNGNINWITTIGSSHYLTVTEPAVNRSHEIFSSGSFDDSIMVNPPFTNVGSGFSDYTIKLSDQFTGIDDVNNFNIRLFPNPADKFINISLPEGNNFEIRLVNSLGALVDKFIVREKTFEMPVNNLPQGLYFLSVQNENINLCKKVLIFHGQ